MYFRKRPQTVWPVIVFMLWTQLALPMFAAAQLAETPPVANVAPSDDAPVGGDTPPAPEAVPPADTSAAAPAASTPPADNSAAFLQETPPPSDGASLQMPEGNIQFNAGNSLLTQLRQLSLQSQLQNRLPVGVPGAPVSLSLDTLLQNTSLQNMQLPGAPADAQWNMRYDSKLAHMQFGEIGASLTGNDLASFNRTVTGLQVDAVLPKGTLTGLVSDMKAPTRTDTISGQNISGPYTLYSTPMIPGSETVTLNNQRLTRDRDYTIDYALGSLNFLRGRMITPTDQVTVSYSVEDGSSSGRVLALRGSYPVAKGLTVGITHIGLRAGTQDTSAADRTEEDQFQGKNLPGPYYLTYHPIITGSEVLTINARRQTRNVAYTLDNDSGQLLFRPGYLPPYGATVQISYRVATPQVSADRSVTGFDVNWQNGKGLGLTVQTASSAGSAAPVTLASAEMVTDEPVIAQTGVPLQRQVFRLQHAPISAGSDTIRALSRTLVRNQDYTLNYQTGELRLLTETIPTASGEPTLYASYSSQPLTAKRAGNSAMTATATYTSSKLSATARYRKTDPGFTPVDQSGVTAVERAVEWATSYSPTAAFSLAASGDNSRIPTAVGSTGQTALQQQNRSYQLSYHAPKLPTATLQHTTHASLTTDGTTGDTAVSDTATTSWTKHGMTATASLDRTTTQSRQAISSDGANTTATVNSYANTTNTAAASLSYQANEKLDVGVNASANTLTTEGYGVRSQGGGKSLQASANYRPTSKLAFSANVSSNKTAAMKSDQGEISPAQQNSNMTLHGDWQAGKRVTVGVNYAADKYDGGDYGNNASATLSSTIGWQVNDTASINGYLARQQTKPLGATSASTNTLIGLGGQVNLLRNTTLHLNWQRLSGQSSDGVNQLWQTEGQSRSVSAAAIDTGGTPTLSSTKLTAISGDISYRLTDKHDLTLGGEMLRGANTNRTAYGIGWHYHADKNLTFSLDARKVNYADNANSLFNLKDHALSAELSWTF